MIYCVLLCTYSTGEAVKKEVTGTVATGAFGAKRPRGAVEDVAVHHGPWTAYVACWLGLQGWPAWLSLLD